MKKQQGFTLIELMIVVAIIAILAAIAIPQYQNYVARSQVTRVMGEAGNLKTAVEDCFNNGQLTIGNGAGQCNPAATPSTIQADGGNASPDIPPAAGSGDPTITNPMTATDPVTIVATFGNRASARLTQAGSNELTWTRDANGAWACTTTVPQRYRPTGCGG